jgi:hypothetical protein
MRLGSQPPAAPEFVSRGTKTAFSASHKLALYASSL